MKRYFIEVTYIGTSYAGFQIQDNASTIQGEIEKALKVLFRQSITLTGSSRTDAGVHAKQNYFHFDMLETITTAGGKQIETSEYNLNALLPKDIAIRSIREVASDAHSRFNAISRSYIYSITAAKNPFLTDTTYFFPYKLDISLLNEAAAIVKGQTNFEAFSKKNTQVNNFNCSIYNSNWAQTADRQGFQYFVTGNRFLRGMVKALTGTMLRVGTGAISIEQFASIFMDSNNNFVDFSPPSRGLMLESVEFPGTIFI